MVDDAEQLRLLETGHGLGRFIVIHQNHLLAARLDQMVAREGADHLIVLIQNRIAAVAALGDDLAHVVEVVREMEAFQLGIAADAGDGDRLEDLPRHAVGVDRRGDHAGPGGNGPQLLRKLCFAENEAVDIRFQRPADDLRLVAADGNVVLPGKEMLVRALRQGQNDLAGDRVHILAGIVENLALDGSQQIKQRHVPNEGVGDRLHIVVRHVPG